MSYYSNGLPPLTVPGLCIPVTLHSLLPEGNPTQAVEATFFGQRVLQSDQAPPPLLDLSTKLFEVNPNSFPEAEGHGPEILTQEVPNAATTAGKVDQVAKAITDKNKQGKTPLTNDQKAKQRGDAKGAQADRAAFHARKAANQRAFYARCKQEKGEKFLAKERARVRAFRQNKKEKLAAAAALLSLAKGGQGKNPV